MGAAPPRDDAGSPFRLAGRQSRRKRLRRLAVGSDEAEPLPPTVERGY